MTKDNNTDWVEQLEEDIEDPYAAAIEGLNEVTQVLAERVVDIEKWASETPTLDKIAYNPKNSDKNLNFMQIINDLYEKIEFLDKKVENLYRFVRK